MVIDNKTVIEESGHTYNAFGKIFYDCTELATSRQRMYKCDSFEKSLKPNTNLFCYNGGNARKTLRRILNVGEHLVLSILSIKKCIME